MQRIWTVVLSVWAMLAIVAVLAWSHRPAPATPPQAAAQTFVVKTVNGKSQLVVLQPAPLGAAHATTQTSGVPR
jgi:cyanate permease